jgi:hypothetical protein
MLKKPQEGEWKAETFEETLVKVFTYLMSPYRENVKIHSVHGCQCRGQEPVVEVAEDGDAVLDAAQGGVAQAEVAQVEVSQIGVAPAAGVAQDRVALGQHEGVTQLLEETPSIICRISGD